MTTQTTTAENYNCMTDHKWNPKPGHVGSCVGASGVHGAYCRRLINEPPLPQ